MKRLTIMFTCLAALVFASLAQARSPHVPRPGVCGQAHACPSRATGRLALGVGRHAVSAELASEQLPIASRVTGCSRVSRAEVECGVAFGAATYGGLGCTDPYSCPPPQRIDSQAAQLFARRIARDRVLVWYGPGKPEGIDYIVRA